MHASGLAQTCSVSAITSAEPRTGTEMATKQSPDAAISVRGLCKSYGSVEALCGSTTTCGGLRSSRCSARTGQARRRRSRSWRGTGRATRARSPCREWIRRTAWRGRIGIVLQTCQVEPELTVASRSSPSPATPSRRLPSSGVTSTTIRRCYPRVASRPGSKLRHRGIVPNAYIGRSLVFTTRKGRDVSLSGEKCARTNAPLRTLIRLSKIPKRFALSRLNGSQRAPTLTWRTTGPAVDVDVRPQTSARLRLGSATKGKRNALSAGFGLSRCRLAPRKYKPD
jgi:hypothetical protein